MDSRTERGGFVQVPQVQSSTAPARPSWRTQAGDGDTGTLEQSPVRVACHWISLRDSAKSSDQQKSDRI